MATYRTQQKTDLINFLTSNAERAFTIDEIVESMKADPSLSAPPGKSTVYRLMARLVDEGTVTCFSKGGGTKAAYQIMGGARCHHHIHMKCTSCGRLIHMSDEESHRLMDRINSFSQFQVDLHKTLLFGRCRCCSQESTKGL